MLRLRRLGCLRFAFRASRLANSVRRRVRSDTRGVVIMTQNGFFGYSANFKTIVFGTFLRNFKRAIICNMPGRKLVIPRKKIAEFCKRWQITEFSIFGSVLRDDFRPDSDVDVLVTINPNARISLLDIAQMQIELEAIFKRPVDIVEKEGLRNPYRRKEILRTAQVVYAV
jgi:hypothetical protein